jgi:hypothetical protein
VKLVRALIDTGGLSVAAAKRVFATLDSDQSSFAHVRGRPACTGNRGALVGTAGPRARDRILRLAEGRGWGTTPANPGFEVAARALDAFSTIGIEPSDEYLEA